jgi:tetratricopeptide (TPR) repeat protein
VLCALSGTAAFASFTDLGMGARAPGMGDAYSAVADDVYAIYYNPAGLGTMARPQLGATYSRLFVGLTDGSSLGQQSIVYAHPLQGGADGTLGIGYQNFSLDGLYSERTIGVSYGRLGWKTRYGDLYWGASIKQLSHSFGTAPETLNSCAGVVCGGGPDPVLTGPSSKSAMDADAGLLLRGHGHFSYGLSISHLTSPNVAFASGDTDPVPMLTRLGASYHTLWMNLATEIRTQQAPTGDRDNRIAVAIEREFPTLESGQFTLRGSIGLGTREFKQFTAGGSYQISKLRFDYAFVMPVGSVQGTLGTHRLAITYLFAGPNPEGEYAAAMVSQMKSAEHRAKAGLGYERSDAAAPAPLDNESLAPIQAKIAAGKYAEARDLLLEKIRKDPGQPGVLALARRLDAVAAVEPEAPAQPDKADLVEGQALKAFFDADDHRALLLVAYARSLAPDRERIAKMVVRLEEMTQSKAEAAPKNRNLWQEKHAKAEASYAANDYLAALTYTRDALALEPTDVLGLERLGTNLFMLGRFDEAIEQWRKAEPLEKTEQSRKALQSFIERAKQAKAGRAATKKSEEAPAEEEEAPQAKPSAREIEALYQLGVDQYGKGDTTNAAATFEKILKIDPENASALKALERIRRRSE